MAKKPLLFADDRPEVERFNPYLLRGNPDPSRIPGWSEYVQANDIAKADDLYFREQNGMTKEDAYKLIGAHPKPLEVEFRWLPVSGPSGARNPNAERTLDYYQSYEGFRVATVEDLESRGYKLPPAARVEADGTIRRGYDVALFVRSGEVARLWERYKAEETAKREGSHLPTTFSEGAYATETTYEEIERKTVHLASKE